MFIIEELPFTFEAFDLLDFGQNHLVLLRLLPFLSLFIQLVRLSATFLLQYLLALFAVLESLRLIDRPLFELAFLLALGR